MGVSKKWASLISAIASSLYAFIIIFQIPLFRVACWSRSCHTPLEVLSSYLVATQLLPSPLVKALLYPGAIAKSLLAGSGLPCFHSLLTSYGFHHHTYRSSFSTHIHHLEVFAGSCLCLLGALLSLFKPTRISFIGTLLIYWGLIRDILLFDSAHSLHVYPTFFLASLSAFLSVRTDVRRIIRCCCTSKPFSKSL